MDLLSGGKENTDKGRGRIKDTLNAVSDSADSAEKNVVGHSSAIHSELSKITD